MGHVFTIMIILVAEYGYIKDCTALVACSFPIIMHCAMVSCVIADRRNCCFCNRFVPFLQVYKTSFVRKLILIILEKYNESLFSFNFAALRKKKDETYRI